MTTDDTTTSTPPALTANQRSMMLHAVGGDPRHDFRNFYCVPVGIPEYDEWQALVGLGLAEQCDKINDDVSGTRNIFFHLTPAGIAAITPTEPPPADTLTPEQAFAVWRQLRAAGHEITIAPSWHGDGQEYCCIVAWDGAKWLASYEAYADDPLVAFSKAVRAFREGQGAE